MLKELIIFILVFLISINLLKFIIPKFKKSFLDIPIERSSHINPTPRAGGIIFVITSLLLSIYYQNFIPLICLPLAIIGLVDDRKNIPPLFKYPFQVITSLTLIYYSDFNTNIFNFDVQAFNILLIFLLILISTALINFINFMDGVDGLITVSMITPFFYLIFNGQLFLIPVLASLFAFLIFNWSPAKIFMGDIGSTFLGAIYVGALFQIQDINTLLTGLIIISPLIFDTSFTLLRRIINRQRIFDSHKLHLYQRLNQSGWSHPKVSLLYGSSILFIAFNSFYGGILLASLTSVIILILGTIIDRFIAIPFHK
mgnify:CR=1 FL=1